MSGRNQVRQWEHNVPFDCPLQVARSVFRIRALREQIIFDLRRAVENELVRPGSHQHPLLHHAELDFQNLFQVFRTQRFEDHNLIDAVHELGREFAPGRVNSSAVDLLVQRRIDLHRFRRESKTTIDQAAHFTGAKV